MKRTTKILIRLIMVVFVMVPHVYSFDLNSLLGDMTGKDRSMGLLLSDVDFRKKQKEELENERGVFEKRTQDAIRTINKTLQSIDDYIKETQTKIKDASGSYEELLKKKLALLNNRKQNRVNFQDFWKEIDSKIVRHIKLISNIIDYLTLTAEEKEERLVYSWKDLDETKGKIDQLTGEVAAENLKKERFEKLKTAEKEEIASLRKEIDAKNVEKEKLSGELSSLTEKEEGAAFVSEVKAKADIIEQEIDFLREKIEVAEFKLEDLVREDRYKEDEIFLLKQKLNRLNAGLLKIQKKLIVDVADVEIAKGELEKETRKAIEIKDQLNREKDVRKIRRDGLIKSIRFLEKQLETIKQTGEVKSVEAYVIDSRLLVVKHERLVIDKELDLLETKKESSEILVQLKQLKAQVIEVLHVLSMSKEKIDDWLVDFRAKKRAAEYTKKVLKDKRDEVTGAIAAINIEKESLQTKQKEVDEQREKIFRRQGKEYFEVLTNLKRAINALLNQKLIVERHFSQISELLLRQEEVVNQYNFIIKYLESQRTVGIWKRSPRAISLEQFIQSGYEIESFFKGLFWDTPTYVSPVALFKMAKDASGEDYLGGLLFLLLYLFLLIAVRLFLLWIHKNVREWFGGVTNSFVAGIEGLIQFILHHFKLIFTWLFLHTHIIFGFSYFRPLTVPYCVGLFYFVSVPLLIYLARSFVLQIRDVNKEHGFLFISESLQWKVTMLIEIFLYATLSLLPLRKAFLEYFERDVAFSEVSLAAYTLILVVIILFFFNKDDVIRLLASRNLFVAWLRQKVDRYYYPVFLFFMMLLILSNPYIGYSNLAWFLAFAIPATAFLAYGLFFLHYLVRKYSVFFFIKEEDDEVIDKFEHAKTYYGFFVALTFLLLALIALVVMVRIWGFEGYTLGALWHSLSNEWVIKVGAGPTEKLGLVEFLKLGLFITGGLLASSLINKFILGKIFEIFRTEPGAQNTISMILHYFIIILVVILGFTAINLSQYALAVGGLLVVGVGFGLQNQIADYFAGVLILLERPIEIGHYVETLDGHRGRVHKISARSTTIKTARNFFITVPNRDLISKPISNWGQGRYPVGAEVSVTVSYDCNPDLVRETLLGIIKEHPMVLRVPAPVVRMEGFEDSAILFYCRAYISARRVTDMWELASDLRFSLIKAFREKDIVIPYPQRVMYWGTSKTKGHRYIDPINIKFDRKD